MEKCFKLKAGKKFFDNFFSFLLYGNEVEAFAENRFFSI